MSQYESHNLEERELPFIYREMSIAPGKKLGASNWHENIELLYILEGGGEISNNGVSIPVKEGDIVVINANHLHAFATGESKMRYKYLIVDRSFCLTNGFDSTRLSFDEQISDTAVRDLMDEIEKAYAADENEPYRVLRIRSLILSLMLLLCRDHSRVAPDAKRPERSLAYVKGAIDYIRANYDKDISLDDVAEFVGVNKCYLSREFHKYTGYPFVAYINMTRCKMARQLLLDEKLSISEIGARAGFENPSYFAKSFVKYIGMLPSEYRSKKKV